MDKVNICEAIKNLPPHLVTQDMIEAGIEEGKDELINILPAKWLTTANIKKIINKKIYSFGSFNLSKVPEKNRDKEICEYAVKEKVENYIQVPEKYKSLAMLLEIVSSAKRNMYLFPYIPQASWTTESAYKGIKSIGSSSSDNNYYGRKSRYNCSYNPDTKDNIRHIQVLLTFVPANLKDKVFYHGLFDNTNLSADDINFLTPDKLKDKIYFQKMSGKDISFVPVDKYTYEGIMAALESATSIRNSDVFEDVSDYNKFIFKVMDDPMADVIAAKYPAFFSDLPDKFKTAERLLMVIEKNPSYQHFENLVQEPEDCTQRHKRYEFNKKLLTRPVCFALIKRNKSIPQLPKSIWDKEFIDHCLKYSMPYYWVSQMPKQLQTQEFVNELLDKDVNKVEYVHQGFINSNLAIKVFREKPDLKKYLPQYFFSDFHELTGLPDNYYGGETTFFNLKDNKKSNHYCKVGNLYIAFQTESNYRDASSFVTVTRDVSGGKPEFVFRRRVQTFHANWLEKIVADYDRQYIKPVVNKTLKEYQLSPYYDVAFDRTKDGVDIYCNKFCGEIIMYVAKVGYNILSRETRKGLIAVINSEVKGSEPVAC